MNPVELTLEELKSLKLKEYSRRRDNDPTITIFWLAARDDRVVRLNSWSCPFCKTTVFDEMIGEVGAIVNVPINLTGYKYAFTARCRFCRQNFRVLANEFYQG